MTFYLGVYGIIAFTSYIFQFFVKPPYRRVFKAIWGGVILLLLAAFRSSSVGVDTPQYINAYKYLANVDFKTALFGPVLGSFERGYVLLCKLFLCISSSERFFLIWTTLLSMIPVIIFVARYSRNPILSYYFYILTQYMFLIGVIRQSIALGFAIISYVIVIEHKKGWAWKACFFIFVASSIHYGALVGLLFIFMSFFKKTSVKYYSVICVIILITVLFGNQIASFTVRLVNRYVNYASSSDNGIGRVIISTAVLIYFLLYRPLIYENDDNALYWEFFLVLSLIIQLFSYSFIAATRAVLIINISYCIIIPNILSYNNIKNKVIWGFFIIFSYYLFFGMSIDPRNAYVFLN